MAFWRQSRFWLILAILLVVISLIVTFISDYRELKKREITDENIYGQKEQQKLYFEYRSGVGDKTRLIVEIKEINQSYAIGRIIVVTRDETYTKSKYILIGNHLSDDDDFFSWYELSASGKWGTFPNTTPYGQTDDRADEIVKLSDPDIIKINGKEIVVFSKDDVFLSIKSDMLFPFDEYIYSIKPDIDLLNDQGKRSNSVPEIEIRDETNSSLLTPLNWPNRPYVEKVDFFNLSIKYYRPAYVITSVLAVIILSLVVSCWTLIRMLRSKERDAEILAITVSLAVSIPAFRQIQVPSDIMFAPLYDIPILIVWSVSILTIFAYMLRSNEENKKNRNDKEPEQPNKTEENVEDTATNETDPLKNDQIDQEENPPELT